VRFSRSIPFALLFTMSLILLLFRLRDGILQTETELWKKVQEAKNIQKRRRPLLPGSDDYEEDFSGPETKIYKSEQAGEEGTISSI